MDVRSCPNCGRKMYVRVICGIGNIARHKRGFMQLLSLQAHSTRPFDSITVCTLTAVMQTGWAVHIASQQV